MTLKDKAATVACEAELDGFIDQLKRDGLYTKSAESICGLRRAELKGQT
jgi:hypothetical protein